MSEQKKKGTLTGARAVKVTDDMGHASLVAHDGRQMNRLLGVILGRAYTSIYVPATRTSLHAPWGTP